MTTQREALRLADALEISSNHHMRREAAAELRRLHAELRRLQIDGDARDVHLSERMKDLFKVEAQRDALLEALKTVEWHGGGSCWVVDADKIAAAIKAAEENT